MPRRAEQFLAFIKSAHGYYSNYPVYAPVVGNGALGRPYNVLANKAIGNGVADDYKSIQGVLNALASSNGGGVAEFPAGYTFGVSQPLVVPGNFVYLKGPGRNRDFSDTPTFPNNLTTFPPMCAIKPLSNFPIGQPLITFGSLSNSYMQVGGGISDILLAGNGAPGNMVNILNNHDVILDRLTIESASGRGVYGACNIAGGISNTYVTNSLIRNLSDAGVYFDAGMKAGNHVDNNYISSVANYGVLNNDIQNHITNNYIENVAANTGYSAGTGIYNGGAYATIANNTVNGTGLHGIYDGVNICDIDGNTILAPNTSNASNGSGIYVENNPTGVVAIGNTIFDPNAKMKYGIYSNMGTSGQFLATNNPIQGAVTAPIGWNGNGNFQARSNPGANPVGLVTVTVPASGATSSTQWYDRTFYIAAGASSVGCAITNYAGTSQTLATIPSGGFGAVFVPAGSTFTPTYSSAPTWTVQGI